MKLNAMLIGTMMLSAGLSLSALASPCTCGTRVYENRLNGNRSSVSVEISYLCPKLITRSRGNQSVSTCGLAFADFFYSRIFNGSQIPSEWELQRLIESKSNECAEAVKRIDSNVLCSLD